MVPEPALIERFRKDLDALIAPDARIGIAVSGGPDSLALVAALGRRPAGQIEVATVDHRLRPESAEEAEKVARLCERLGVPHATLTAEWAEKPSSAIQERARDERYRLLGAWLAQRSLAALATAHHADDQAETLVMRLNRGAGVRGLAAMRPAGTVPGTALPLLRPLLGWRRAELQSVCATAGFEPADDPSNRDTRYERVRVRRDISAVGWLDPEAVARSAAFWPAPTSARLGGRPGMGPRRDRSGRANPVSAGRRSREIIRRIVALAMEILCHEGGDQPLRGRELDNLLEKLAAGRTATLRGVRCSGGAEWKFVPARQRNRPVNNRR